MAPKVPAQELEREYVTGKLSIRELARQHDMAWSTIAARARRDGWTEKRESYQDSLTRRTYEKTADKFAQERAEIHTESVIAMRATVRAYIKDLNDGNIRVSPKDATVAVNTLLLLLGEPTSRTESKIVEFSTGGLEQDVLRRLAEFARTRVIEGTVSEPLGPEPPGTGEE